MKRELMTVGELAKQMNVTVRTLQYYDRQGILKPSALSEGGRRLYSAKDVIQLHQILSFKYLGFSLEEIKKMASSFDTPQEVAGILERQKTVMEQQLDHLKSALRAIEALREEVLLIDQVDFEKYADIIQLLRMDNDAYWSWKLFDKTVQEHIRSRFTDRPNDGLRILETYRSILDEGIALKRRGEAPEGKAGKLLAKRWWEMIMEFTGGNMSLLPKLVEFNSDKAGWDKELAGKQEEFDDYIEKAIEAYFIEAGIQFPEMGEA